MILVVKYLHFHKTCAKMLAWSKWKRAAAVAGWYQHQATCIGMQLNVAYTNMKSCRHSTNSIQHECPLFKRKGAVDTDFGLSAWVSWHSCKLTARRWFTGICPPYPCALCCFGLLTGGEPAALQARKRRSGSPIWKGAFLCSYNLLKLGGKAWETGINFVL